MKRSLSSLAESIQAQLVGDGAVEVSGIASIPQATPEDLVFVEDEKHLRLAMESRAAAVIVGKFAGKSAKKSKNRQATPDCASSQVGVCSGRQVASSHPDRQPGNPCERVVHSSARLGKDVSCG